jgi:ABC-type transporter Mla maintaining outer membrane lipid asymmetry ATPase subunit MlaF
MKTAVAFDKVEKFVRSSPILRLDDLRISERESVAFYGLPPEHAEIIVNLMTGATLPDEGSVRILGTDSRAVAEERDWFEFVENFGIYDTHHSFQEGVSIGENVASLYRLKNESMEEPQLSAAVLKIANLVQLTITDLSKMIGEATPLMQSKIRLSRALAYQPRILILLYPTESFTLEVSRQFAELLKRTKRKQRYTLVLFTSDIHLAELVADRVIFLNPISGLFIENQLRGWYHRLLPFLDPAPERLLQLSRDILQHGRMIRSA